MAKHNILLCFLAVFCFALTSDATTYMVGDTSGWDIATDIDSWASDKIFKVGDVLLFQYSSYHSVSEVSKQSFDSCNTTNTLTTFSNGNTTVTLSKPGARYFVCGNRLHCLGGMKLQVDVQDDQANSTVGAPQAQPGAALPQPSSKSNNPSTVIPTSNGFVIGGTGLFVIPFLSLIATMLILVKI
ncbi:Plastocyanin-like protein [Corchorus olitorius]|uniref:Plastocyanin-like protein n=1 Tax=Corchorus olitorius TaxID=93759 RepID=A0A1R3G2F6_9ROSI|nr:Plastocyanin-like protein [Corchorus olitorius]